MIWITPISSMTMVITSFSILPMGGPGYPTTGKTGTIDTNLLMRQLPLSLCFRRLALKNRRVGYAQCPLDDGAPMEPYPLNMFGSSEKLSRSY